MRITYTYNASSQLTVQLAETWRKNAWQNSSRETYTYDRSNYPATKRLENWDTTANSWKNFWLFTFTNNSDGTIDHSLTQEWDTLSSTWRTARKNIYTYDSDKNVTEILGQEWHDNKWENTAKFINTYNAVGKQITSLHQTVYGSSSQLVNNWRWTNTYDNNNYLTTFLYQVWDYSFNLWVNATQEYYTNKPDGKVYQIFTQTWFENDWVDESRKTFFLYYRLHLTAHRS